MNKYKCVIIILLILLLLISCDLLDALFVKSITIKVKNNRAESVILIDEDTNSHITEISAISDIKNVSVKKGHLISANGTVTGYYSTRSFSSDDETWFIN